jgi:hypothetical protein
MKLSMDNCEGEIINLTAKEHAQMQYTADSQRRRMIINQREKGGKRGFETYDANPVGPQRHER